MELSSGKGFNSYHPAGGWLDGFRVGQGFGLPTCKQTACLIWGVFLY